MPIVSTSFTVGRPRASRSSSGSPTSRSMMRKGSPASVCPTSSRLTTFGCRTDASAIASRRKRSRAIGSLALASAASCTFATASSPLATSRTAQMLPMAPIPTRRSIR